MSPDLLPPPQVFDLPHDAVVKRRSCMAGVSMFQTVEQAVSTARQIPKIVAAVQVSGHDILVHHES